MILEAGPWRKHAHAILGHLCRWTPSAVSQSTVRDLNVESAGRPPPVLEGVRLVEEALARASSSRARGSAGAGAHAPRSGVTASHQPCGDREESDRAPSGSRGTDTPQGSSRSCSRYGP